MNIVEIKLMKISEELPKDGQECWVQTKCKGYPTFLVFNKAYYCWDDSFGDDYECDVTDDDIWMALPKALDKI